MSETPLVQAEENILDLALYNEQGLIPVIAQDATSRQVLMMAWMDREALRRTLAEGRVTYFSRSRSEYWRKGDTSGHHQHAISAVLDCDRDVILLTVEQTGPACHRGTTGCFDHESTHG
jgi:phosphoribosyl-AMP cyclohydrolase